MSSLDRGQPVEVHVGECRCPGTPHASGDVVLLRPRPDTAMRFAVVQAINDAGDDPSFLFGTLMGVYLRMGPVRWNLVDEKGESVSIVDLGDALGMEGEIAVANKADELYTERITGPLHQTVSDGPEHGQTEHSTSPPSPTPISSAQSSPSRRARSTSSTRTGALR